MEKCSSYFLKLPRVRESHFQSSSHCHNITWTAYYSVCANVTAHCLSAGAVLAYASRSGLVCRTLESLPGSASPNASAMICMVDAVPIKVHAPQLGRAFAFCPVQLSASSISPRSYFALYMPSCSRVSRSRSGAHCSARHHQTAGTLTRASPNQISRHSFVTAGKIDTCRQMGSLWHGSLSYPQ